MGSRDGNGFLDYLELQDSPNMITKSELLAEVRQQGGAVSDRTLSFYGTVGLLPKAVRVGSRSGVYPEVVADLLMWIVQSRKRGLSVEAIQELVPLWKHLFRARRERRLDLMEFEYLARQHVMSPEAVHAVPGLFPQMLCANCDLPEMTFVLKDGTEVLLKEDPRFTLGILYAAPDPETGKARCEGFGRMTFPLEPIDPKRDPTTLILGIPNGVEPPRPDHGRSTKPRRPASHKRLSRETDRVTKEG